MSRDGGCIAAVLANPRPKESTKHHYPVFTNGKGPQRFFGVATGEWPEDPEPGAAQIDGIVTVKLKGLTEEERGGWRYHNKVYCAQDGFYLSGGDADDGSDGTLSSASGDAAPRTPIGFLLDLLRDHARVQLDRSLQFRPSE